MALYQAFVTGNSLRASTLQSGIDRAPQTCKRMLANTTYLGTDFFPQLISHELFCAVQTALASRELARKPRELVSPKRPRKRRHARRVPVVTEFEVLPDTQDADYEPQNDRSCQEPLHQEFIDQPDVFLSATPWLAAAAHAARQYARIRVTNTLKEKPRAAKRDHHDSSSN